MNSFRTCERGIDAEIARQDRGLAGGERRAGDAPLRLATPGRSTPLRGKEEAHDYRYFPEPDLVPLEIDPAWVDELRRTQPELPAARVERFSRALRALARRRQRARLVGALAGFYEEVVAAGAGAKPAANWTMGEYLAHLNAAGLEAGHGHVTAERLARLVKLVEDGTVSTSAGKDVFAKMIEERAEPEAIVEKHSLGQISDTSELEAVVAEVVAANPAQVEQYRGGKQQVIGFFVGQVMKASGGRANPQVVNDLLRRALDA